MKCAIFDLDGTLIDSMEVWKKADYALLKKYGRKPDEEYSQKIITLNFTQGAEFIIQKFEIDRSPEEIKEELFQMVQEEYFYHLNLKEGVREYLHFLKRKGIPLAIATSSIRKMCEAVLKRNEIYHLFDEIVFAEEEGKGKEDPAFFLETAKRIGVSSEECVVFEDTLHAAEGAKKAGMTVIGVFDSYSSKQEEKMKQCCDRYIFSFQELLQGRDK